MITVGNLMILERFLLEIENRFKFDLKLGEAVELYQYLKEIGKITNLFFLLQQEYFRKYGDKEKLEEYHNRLMNDNVKINTHKMIELVKEMSERCDDDEFKEIVAKNKFWD